MLYRCFFFVSVAYFTLLSIVGCSSSLQEYRVPHVMEKTIRKIYQRQQVDLFKDISQQEVLTYFDADGLQILANDYWVFEVNADAEVFVCRDMNQKEVPFWLTQHNFQKTKDTVKNDNVTYEVWRKVFKKGQVQLGVNGFDRHRYVYFVVVKALEGRGELKIRPIWPIVQQVNPVEIGSVVYHDWEELTLTQIPTHFKGGYVLPIIRGRSREAHLIGAFRHTTYPATLEPDQLIRTWTDDPKTTLDLSWRTNTNVETCSIAYWQQGQMDTSKVRANETLIQDVLLANDPDIKRFNVQLTNLKPGTAYGFQILSGPITSKVYTFKTDSGKAQFEFGWFGDVHNDERWGHLLPRWRQLYPEAKFYLQVGDLVNTGLYRDQWDQLLHAAQPILDDKPFMAVPGNHDSQEGLFPSMYLHYLKYPHNGPTVAEGLSYHFVYGNTLFLMLDVVGTSVSDQKKWLEEVLEGSKERFKIAVFHFAPHTAESTYTDIIQIWEPLFKKYEVDLVLTGHFHYYHRTQLNREKSHSPIYIMSVGTKEKGEEIEVKTGDVGVHKGYLYQHVKIDGNSLHMRSVDSLGNNIDEFKLTKTN